MKRDEWGSWLGGDPARAAEGAAAEHRGARLGLPAEGPGAMASASRRVVALAIDWAACMLVAYLVWRSVEGLRPLLVFALESVVLLATIGSTAGHRITGLRVVRLGRDGQRPATSRPGVGIVPALVRTLLVCVVIPAVVWDSDGRGMHDRAAGTVLVRR